MKKRMGKCSWRILVLAAGTFFLTLGLFLGQAEEVMRKAIHICLECVGIG